MKIHSIFVTHCLKCIRKKTNVFEAACCLDLYVGAPKKASDRRIIQLKMDAFTIMFRC